MGREQSRIQEPALSRHPTRIFELSRMTTGDLGVFPFSLSFFIFISCFAWLSGDGLGKMECVCVHLLAF